ncbi:MAG TPA: hypothetical protein VG223_17160 [Solirubrobacteraceae bacterium]|nr:hypothetical protein [Solirubrobacteraceae bacterium]
MRAGSSSTARQLGAIIVLATTIGLVLVDVLSPGVREWWGRHDFTTSVVAGMLVLLLTVLVADRVVSARQLRERSRAIAAQAAILMAQAGRTASVVSAVRDDPESRDAASEEVRTYMTMLLISAPVLMNAQLSLAFLEDAQRLGGELARALALAQAPLGRDTADRVGAAAEGVRASARPLLAILNADELMAAVTDGNAGADP